MNNRVASRQGINNFYLSGNFSIFVDILGDSFGIFYLVSFRAYWGSPS